MNDDEFAHDGANECGEILAVDDTVESLTYLCEILRGSGHVVRAAPSGELALWSACSKPPDLILLDVRMPVMDGFDVCRRLKADPRTAQVPVIFLTAYSDIEHKVQAFSVGGVDYISKPFEPDEVLQRVGIHLRLARLTKALEAARHFLEQRVRERTAELNSANQQLRLVANAFETSFSGMFITDTQGTIQAINPAFTSMTGYQNADCVGRNINLLRSNRHDAAYFEKMWQSIAAQGRWAGEIWNQRKDGTVIPQLLSISVVPDGTGKNTHYVGSLSDLSEISEAREVINHLVHHDALTGLPNRLIAQDRFNQLAETLASDESIAIICINLDRFRQINDRYGHDTGNVILQWLAECLKQLIPSGDTLFREGADEFIVIHHQHKGLVNVRLLAETLGAHLKKTRPTEISAAAFSASIGIATYPADGVGFDELIANASLALRRIKDQGGGGCACFSEQLDQGMRTRFDIAQQLPKALAQGEFEVYLQPQTEIHGSHRNMRNKRIVSAEALLRWKSPELGVVSPAQFIPVAEETGDIIAMGNWVMNTVCDQIAAWRSEGLGDIRVAVNLSARQFMSHETCISVAEALTRTGIPPACLELEITESALIDDVQKAITILHQLKQLGISISLDDFGTGYSSLTYLKKFPLDFLKVDQSFVRDLIIDDDANAIVLSIISLAHNMRMEVIAEGVETGEQMEFLVKQGCNLLQGYYLGRPMPAAEFRELILAQHTH